MKEPVLTDLQPVQGHVRIKPIGMYLTKDSKYQYDYSWTNFPGWTKYIKTLNGAVRGGIRHNDTLIVVVNNVVYRVQHGGQTTQVGVIASKEGFVSMADNGFEVMLADGVNMYRYNGGTVSVQTMPFSTGPTRVVFHDGYFITFQPNTAKFFISDQFDGTTWNALQFATAEDQPDNIKEIHSDRLLWIFGETSVQAYDHVSSLFPFIPNYQGRMLYGIRGRTVAALDNTSYWLGISKDGGLGVYRIRGYAPEPVSIPEYEEEWSTFDDIDDAYASTFSWKRHEFYVLTFPRTRRTFVYDSRSDVWSEWGLYDETTGRFLEHPANFFVYYDNLNLFGDSSGNIFYLDKDTTKMNGETSIRELWINTLSEGNHRYSFDEFWLSVDSGKHDPSINPTIMLSISNDFGNSFGSWLNASFGRTGKYNTRCRWLRLGSGYSFVFRVRISDDINWTIRGGGLI